MYLLRIISCIFSESTSSFEQILTQQSSNISNLSLQSRDNLSDINRALTTLNASPILFKKRKVEPYIRKKILDVSVNLSKSLGIDTNNSDIPATVSDAVDMITRLKNKFHEESTSRSEKLQILTILPSTWSAAKISRVMNSTEYMAKYSKRLAKEKGILGTTASKPRKNN